MTVIHVQINIFGPFIEPADVELLKANPKDLRLEFIKQNLEWFFKISFSGLERDIIERYIEATTKDTHLNIVPHTEEIFERLLKPLILAKKSYALGEYITTFALCGIVGEMLAILIWKIGGVSVKGKPITESDEELLFGRTFEKVQHYRRLNILKAFGLIDEEMGKKFKLLSEKRNQFLHSWAPTSDNEKKDALSVLLESFRLLKEITQIGLADGGTVTVNPKLLKLFEELNKNKL
jgi:hypothetical protein